MNINTFFRVLFFDDSILAIFILIVFFKSKYWIDIVWGFIYYILFISFCLIISEISFSQDANDSEYVVTRYSNLTSVGTIEDMYLGNDGFLWLSTQNGIHRLDGQKEMVFNRFNTSNLTCLRFGHIEDFGGYINGENGSIYYIDKSLNRPVLLDNPIMPFRNQILKSKSERLRFEMKLLHSYGQRVFNFFSLYSRDACFFPVNWKNSYFVNSSGDLYFISKNNFKHIASGILSAEKNAFTVRGYFLYQSNSKLYLYNRYGRVAFNSILTKGEHFKEAELENARLFKTSKNYFILLLNDKLYLLSPGVRGLHVSQINIKAKIENVKCAEFIPNIGIIILGTGNSGIYIVKRSYFKTISLLKPDNNRGVYSTTPVNSDEVILSNGLIFNLKSSSYRRKFYVSDFFGAYYLWDSKRNLWYIDNGNLIKLDSKLNFLNKWNLHSEFDNIFGFKQLSENFGQLWFCSNHELLRITPANKIVITKVPKLGVGEWIQFYHFVSKAKVWIGTNSRLIEYDFLRRKSRQLLSNSNIRTIYKDFEGDIWVSTYGEGIFLFREGKFLRVPIDLQMNSLVTHDLILDKSGIIWMSSNNGLLAISKRRLIRSIRNNIKYEKFVFFTNRDGLLTNEFNGGRIPCAYFFGKNFFFPSMKGLVYFDPQKTINRCSQNISKNSLIIDMIDCDGQTIENSSDFSLPPTFKYLNIDISFVFWGKVDNLKKEYKLLGYDNKRWIELKPRENIHLSNLPYGDYTLIIKVSNHLKNDSFVVKKIAFKVKPYYYQTVWFKVLVVLGFILLSYFLYRLRLNFLVLERNRLQREVADKVNRLVKSKQELEISFNRINSLNEQLEQSNDVRAKLVSIFVHDLKSPMRFLSLVAKKVYLQNDLLTLEQIKEMTGELYSYSVSTMNYIEQFLLWQAVNQNGFVITIEEVEIAELFDEIYTSFASICQKQGNTLLVKSTPEIMIKTDRMLLLAIIRNLLDNANKYTFNGRIELSAEFVLNDLDIKIKDTGKGMTPDVLEMIKGYLNQNSLGHVNTHIGYQIVGDFMKKLNGTIELVSEGEGKGLEVILRFER